MENLTEFIKAISALIWPAIVIVILFRFKDSFKSIIESAKSREFTIKVAGNELTMEEASEKQRALISDLQNQIIKIQEKLENKENVSVATDRSIKQEDRTVLAQKQFRILWVDDRPRNNSYEIASLRDKEIIVETALTTNEGLSLFNTYEYNMVLSDMGRKEGAEYIHDAGINLADKIRQISKNIPLGIYCSAKAAFNYREKAKNSGINMITASTVELMNFIEKEIKSHTRSLG